MTGRGTGDADLAAKQHSLPDRLGMSATGRRHIGSMRHIRAAGSVSETGDVAGVAAVALLVTGQGEGPVASGLLGTAGEAAVVVGVPGGGHARQVPAVVVHRGRVRHSGGARPPKPPAAARSRPRPNRFDMNEKLDLGFMFEYVSV
eukprot:1183122-Prorocentrum_minimum.AAC.2